MLQSSNSRKKTDLQQLLFAWPTKLPLCALYQKPFSNPQKHNIIFFASLSSYFSCSSLTMKISSIIHEAILHCIYIYPSLNDFPNALSTPFIAYSTILKPLKFPLSNEWITLILIAINYFTFLPVWCSFSSIPVALIKEVIIPNAILPAVFSILATIPDSPAALPLHHHDCFPNPVWSNPRCCALW